MTKLEQPFYDFKIQPRLSYEMISEIDGCLLHYFRSIQYLRNNKEVYVPIVEASADSQQMSRIPRRPRRKDFAADSSSLHRSSEGTPEPILTITWDVCHYLVWLGLVHDFRNCVAVVSQTWVGECWRCEERMKGGGGGQSVRVWDMPKIHWKSFKISVTTVWVTKSWKSACRAWHDSWTSLYAVWNSLTPVALRSTCSFLAFFYEQFSTCCAQVHLSHCCNITFFVNPVRGCSPLNSFDLWNRDFFQCFSDSHCTCSFFYHTSPIRNFPQTFHKWLPFHAVL